MKKISILLASLLSVGALCACGSKEEQGNPDDIVKNVKGGSDTDREAIQKAAKMSIVQLSGSSGLLPGSTTDIQEDNGDFIKLTTKQTLSVNKTKCDVVFEYSVDETNPYFAEFAESDANHKLLMINYPGQKGNEGSMVLNLSKVSCGKAVSTNPEVKYTLNVKKATWYHKDVHIADLTKVNDAGTGYEIVDYESEPSNAYYAPNPENAGLDDTKQYFYVNCYGKVIYNSPDGNWGLIAEGDDVMEIYAGSALNIAPSRYPTMNGKYVKVVGNMSQYNGNMQIGFITDMKKASASDIEEPTLNYEQITPQMIGQITDGDHHKQVIKGADNLPNSLAQITGKYVEGSVSTESRSKSARFTFKMNIGTDAEPCNVTVAYDYHTDKDGSVGLFNKIQSTCFTGQSVTIKGTLRFTGSNSAPFNQTGGEWQLVPFLADHVA